MTEAQRTPADLAFREFRRTGDPRRLGELYDTVAPELLRVALHLTRDAAEAEDALQATFVAAIERAPSFDPSRPVLPWLAGILALEAQRAAERARRAPDPARLGESPASSPEIEAQRAELLERLDACVEKLPEASRPVLLLRVRHGLSATEIAAVLGRPPGTVRSQLARGLELLRRTLPKSLAGALVAHYLAAPTRGLAAIREVVLAHALPVPLAVAPAVTLAGMLAMKKIAAFLALCAALLWLAWPERPGADASARGAAPAPSHELPPTHAGPRRAAESSPEPAHEELARVEAPPPAAPAAPEPLAVPVTATLRVVARTEDGGAPAEGEVVLVQAQGDSWRSEDARIARTDASGVVELAGLVPGHAYVRLLRGGEDGVDLAAGKVSELRLRLHPGATIDGEVVDASERPVPEAEIWLSERYRTNIGHVLLRTDRSGRFELGPIGPDHYLSARAPGYAASALRSVRGAPGERRSVRLVLEREGIRLQVRVLDDGGSPIARAHLLLGAEIPPPSERLDDGSLAYAPPPIRSQSDADGTCALEGVPRALLPLQVRARGFAPFAGELDTELGLATPFEVRLAREARVAGRAVDERNRPLSAVWVHAGEPETFAWSSTHSGLDGRFELAGLAAGVQRVFAEHRELGRAETELRLSPGETREWNVELAREPRIFGSLLDERGAPLEGWTVVAWPGDQDRRRTKTQRVEGDGRFALVGLADEPHTLWVQRPGGWREFPLRILEQVFPSSSPIEIRVSDRDRESGRIEGRVLGPRGEPVAGAELQVWHVDRHLWRSFTSDAESGALAVEQVPAGRCELELRHPDFPWKHLGAREIRAGETLALGELEFEEPGRLRVRLNGIPTPPLGDMTSVVSDSSGRESGVVRLENGELRSSPLAPGAHVLVVRGDFIVMQRLEIAIAPATETALELDLERCGMRVASFAPPEGAAPPAWISCLVLDAEGRQVWFGGTGGPQSLEVRVSAPAGRYQLAAHAEGGLAARGEFVIASLAGDEPAVCFELSPER